MSEKRQTCTEHCGGCGEHFHGLGAFDRHRVDGFCEDPATVLIQKGKREGEQALQVWTEEGHCDKMAGCWSNGHRLHHVTPVTIYQIATVEESE